MITRYLFLKILLLILLENAKSIASDKKIRKYLVIKAYVEYFFFIEKHMLNI